MKHQEVLNLRAKLQKVKGLKGRELNFEIKTNILEINRITEPLVAMEKEIEDVIIPFDKERNTLFIKNCTVNGIVKRKVFNGQEIYDVPLEAQGIHNQELIDLMTKFKDDIDKYNKDRTEFVKFLNETESKFEISKVKKDCLPEDISTEDMDLIFDIIE